MKNKSVVIGFSGGVDSCASAIILKEAGYDVTAVTLDLVSGIEGCSDISRINAEDAREAAEMIGIRHMIFDKWKYKFENTVVKNFIDEYNRGRTPNPCVLCNPNVKFLALSEISEEIGCMNIATGHYARIFYDAATGKHFVQRAKSVQRDQSYMLYRLTPEILSRVIFPLGDYEKDEIRELVRSRGIKLHQKPDSQENCFIPDNDYAGFIEKRTGTKAREGNYVDNEENILGIHKGIIHYTIGQRKGLGIALGRRMFVTGLDTEKNEVVLGDNEHLFTSYAEAEDPVVHYDFSGIIKGYAKIRSTALPVPCEAECENGILKIHFNDPVRAAVPGQSAVIYDDRGIVLCGGVIR